MYLNVHPFLWVKTFQEVQKDLQTKGDGMLETIRSVEEFLAERGDDLSPEERAKLQAALTYMKDQYHTLTDTAQSSLAQLDSTINTTLQQNTQRVKISRIYPNCTFFLQCFLKLYFLFICSCLCKAKAEEQLQETQGKIDVLLKELSSLDTSRRKSLSETVPDASVPKGSLNSHNDMLKVRTKLSKLNRVITLIEPWDYSGLIYFCLC